MLTDSQRIAARKVNLGHLDDVECEKILEVLQKDFELREKERQRLSKIEEVVKEEENKAEVLAKKTKLNENVCISCCQTFGIIFNRKQTCKSCKLFACKSCCLYDSENKGYVCKVCLKEKELKLKSCDWFYNNVSKKFKRFGSAKIVRTMYKMKSDKSRLYHTDNESDSGYDPSLYNSLKKSGSLKTLNRLQSASECLDSDNELDPSLQTTHKPLPKASSLESLAHRAFNIQTENDNIKTDTRDIYKEAFENTKLSEEKKFRDKFEILLSELQHSLENQSPNGLNSYGSTSYGEVIVNYRNKLRELLASHSQKLQLAIESFDSNPTETYTTTSVKVKQLVSKLVEDSLGESIDLTSDEAVSDLSSLSDESGEHHKSFEDQLAQAVVAKILENQRKENRLGNLQLDRLDEQNCYDSVDNQLTGRNSSFSEERSETEKSDSATSDVDQEFQKLRTFAQDILSPRPTPHEEEVEEILEESPIQKTTVHREEKKNDFDTRLSTFERVHDSHFPLPDFEQEDFEFATNEIDPDLLSMNLAPILEEDEDGYEEEENNNASSCKDKSWKENWIFKGASGISPYDNLGKRRVGNELGEMYMMVPQPEEDFSPQVGNRDADQLSDLSETEEKDDFDNLSDEESSFYAKTSEELARITRKSSSTQSTAHALASHSVQTEDSDLDSSNTSKELVSSLLESGIKGQGFKSEKSDSSADESSVKKSLVEELVPAEVDDPKFEIPPESVTVPEGEPVKFYCRVGGTLPVDIFWYKVSPSHELQELEDSEQFDLTKEGNRYSITMYNPRKSDAGQYMCMVINEKGQCCQYIILTVKKNTQDLKQPEFLKDIKDLEVKEGQSVKFRCKVKGYPQPRVVWYKDRKKLNSDNNIKIEKFGNRDYILTIDCATMDEDAEYSVVAKNIAGEVRSVAQLIIEPETPVETVTPRTPTLPLSNNLPVKKEASPAQRKDDQQLSNLGRKMFMTKDSVTGVAEDMLNTANELTDLHKSLDEMDTMLSTFEQDINPTNTSNINNGSSWSDTMLSHNLGCETVQNYKNMKYAAENVRHATSAALDILNSTENVIDSNKQEIDCLATSTPRCSDDNSVIKRDDHENNNLLLKVDRDQDFNVNSDNKWIDTTSENYHENENLKNNTQRSEFIIKPSNDPIKSVHTSDSNIESSSLSSSNFGSDTNRFSDKDLTVITTEQTEVDTSNFNLNNTQKPQRWKWDINSSSYPPPMDFSQEKKLQNNEDEIYIAAGKVFALEDQVQDLQTKVQSTNNSEKRKMSDLEDEVARTVAQVHQSEKDVTTIERSIGQLHVSAPTSPRSSVWEDNSSNLSSPSLSVDSGFSSMKERPLPTVIVGTTSESEMPESRTEVNEETGVELPSVSRLKAMFNQTKVQDDGSLKRIHSITARSLGKEKLEQIRRNAMQNSPPSPLRPQGTEPSQLTVSLAPTPGGTKDVDQDPTQIFPEDQGTLFPDGKTSIPSKPPRQNQPIKVNLSNTQSESHPTKTTVTSVKKIHAPAPPISQSVVSVEQSQPIKATVTTISRSNVLSETSSHVDDSSDGHKIVEKRPAPKIRSGCISARAAFWEKKIQEEDVDEEEFPEMLEDAIPE